MILMNEIPDRFWSLFRSVNRSTYIEALLKINEEYEYSNYFLSREVCIQLLSEYFSQKKYVIWQDETEDDWDELEPPATRVLNWLLRTGWLRKVDDYASMTVNIVIPDYAAVMIEAFSRLLGDDEDETQVYIQNVYAILFSLKNDPRSSVSLLNTALVNTKKLNKSLQDMLHNMDKFFGSLLEQKNYGTLLKEHLEGYVTEIVNKKYHILKTSDNFYLYKTDIKSWIAAMREDSSWINKMCAKSAASTRGQKKAPLTEYDIVEKLDQLERGFDDIEHRISNMDKETTASNFGKVSDMAAPEDLALGVCNLVFQTVGTLAAFSTRGAGMRDVVLTGNLAMVPMARKVFSDFEKLYDARFIIPDNADFATALGAALAGR